MLWRRGFVSSVLATRREHWYQAFLMLLFGSIGGLAPLWLGYILCLLLHKPVHLLDFAANGEFALYCAASVAPALYMILHERTAARLDGQTILALIAIVILLVSVVAYAFIIPLPSEGAPWPQFNRTSYAGMTALLFGLGLGFSFLIAALDLSRTTPAVREIAEDEKRELRAKFDEIGDKQ